eukprot:COSAG04_NODE_1550_length_6380_cov_2.250597_4_plen_169_part_00
MLAVPIAAKPSGPALNPEAPCTHRAQVRQDQLRDAAACGRLRCEWASGRAHLPVGAPEHVGDRRPALHPQQPHRCEDAAQPGRSSASGGAPAPSPGRRRPRTRSRGRRRSRPCPRSRGAGRRGWRGPSPGSRLRPNAHSLQPFQTAGPDDRFSTGAKRATVGAYRRRT